MAKYEIQMELLIKQLYEIKNDGKELDEYQRGVFDTLSWLVDDSDMPEIRD